jgi:hypothetical protein
MLLRCAAGLRIGRVRDYCWASGPCRHLLIIQQNPTRFRCADGYLHWPIEAAKICALTRAQYTPTHGVEFRQDSFLEKELLILVTLRLRPQAFQMMVTHSLCNLTPYTPFRSSAYCYYST